MKEILVDIPDELQKEIERLELEMDIQLSGVELYQYLIQLGLDAAKENGKEIR